jgi:hypothetical protein
MHIYLRLPVVPLKSTFKLKVLCITISPHRQLVKDKSKIVMDVFSIGWWKREQEFGYGHDTPGGVAPGPLSARDRADGESVA